MNPLIMIDDGQYEWRIDLHGNGHETDVFNNNPDYPMVTIYTPDDAHYSMCFESRASLEQFINQLRDAADEVWPA